MSRVIDLAVKIATSADVGGLDRIGNAAGDMADKVARSAGDAAEGLGGIGDAADNLDDKAGRATGALGALSSGFELMGPQGEAVAAGLQTAAMATDFLSGASQALTLVMDLDIAKKAASTAATVGHTVATTASSAAAGVAAAAQWALNAALSANPIGLVVVALVALTAGVVLAYEKSETFRDVVDPVFKVVKNTIGGVVDTVTDLAGWFSTKVPAAGEVLKDKVVPVIELAFLPLTTTIDVLGKVVKFAREDVPDGIESMKNKVVPFLDAVVAPIKAAYDTMSDLVDKIAAIDFPDLPDNPFGNPFNRTALSVPTLPDPNQQPLTPAQQVFNTFQFTIQGAIDPIATAAQIKAILGRDAAFYGIESTIIGAA